MNHSSLEHLVRRTAQRVGLDIHRHRPAESPTGRLARMLEHHRVDLVLDVGANVGQFAAGLRDGGYRGQIVSFEPLGAAHAALVQRARHDPAWNVPARTAIGDSPGEIDLHVAGNSVSSSALEMLKQHAVAAPGSAYVGRERVPVATLDAIVPPLLERDAVPFLKIDTQGFEDRVLDGARGVLPKIRGVQLELSFLPLYEGQQLFDTLRTRLAAQGFATWALWPGFCDPCSGRMLQVDAVFFRE